jgi:hypothetical protein
MELFGIKKNKSKEAIYSKSETDNLLILLRNTIENLLSGKQNNLIAGDNITIENNVISANSSQAISTEYVSLYKVDNIRGITSGELNQSYKNFKDIVVVFSNYVNDDLNERQLMTIPVCYINSDSDGTWFLANFCTKDLNRYVRIKFTSETNFSINSDEVSNYNVKEIFGRY